MEAASQGAGTIDILTVDGKASSPPSKKEICFKGTGGGLLVDAPTVQPGSQSVSEAIPRSQPPACVDTASDSAPGALTPKPPGLSEAVFQLSLWDVLPCASGPASRDRWFQNPHGDLLRSQRCWENNLSCSLLRELSICSGSGLSRCLHPLEGPSDPSEAGG